MTSTTTTTNTEPTVLSRLWKVYGQTKIRGPITIPAGVKPSEHIATAWGVPVENVVVLPESAMAQRLNIAKIVAAAGVGYDGSIPNKAAFDAANEILSEVQV